MFLLSVPSVFAASYYWVGGSGNWSEYDKHWATASGGSVFHLRVPAPEDHVFFDAASFGVQGGEVVLDETVLTCNNLTFTTGSMPIELKGGSNASLLNIYGSLTMAPGVRVNYAGNLVFKSFGGYTSGIAQKGAVFSSNIFWIFDSPGGSWSVSDSIHVTGINLVNGSLSAIGKKITCREFHSLEETLRSLNCSNSLFTVTNWFELNTNQLNFVSTGSHFQFKDMFRCEFGPATLSFDSIYASGVYSGFYTNSNFTANYFSTSSDLASIYLSGDIVINKMISQSPGLSVNKAYIKDSEFKYLQGLVIGTELKVDKTNMTGFDCGSMLRIISETHGRLVQTSGSFTLQYAYLKNIEAAGGASFVGTNIIDLGGNTGWQITPFAVKTLYWVGQNGDWNDKNHWSFTSGGSPSGCLPNELTNVVFDQNSFKSDGQTVIVTGGACRDLEVKKNSFEPKFSGQLGICGSFLLNRSVNLTEVVQIVMVPAEGNHTIRSGGNYIKGNLYFQGIGTHYLVDALNCSNVNISSGGLVTNGYSLSCDQLTGNFYSGFITMDIRNSKVVVRQGWFENHAASFIAANSTLEIQNGYMVDLGNNLTYHNLIVYGEGTKISGTDCSFNILNINGDANCYGNTTSDSLLFRSGSRIQLNQGLTYVFNYIGITDQGCEFTELFTDGNPVYFKSNLRDVTISKVYLNNIVAQGGHIFKAMNSVDGGGNVGWGFTYASVNTFYWIGGTGLWEDPAHWSLSSNGISAGCVPGPLSDVVFDNASFKMSGQSVRMEGASVRCNSMTWKELPFSVRLEGKALDVGGNLTLHPKLKFNIETVYFSSDKSSTIRTNSIIVPWAVIKKTASITFEDDYQGRFLYVEQGSVNFNKKKFRLQSLDMRGLTNIYMDSAEVALTQDLEISMVNTISAKGSIITVEGGYDGQIVLTGSGPDYPIQLATLKIVPSRYVTNSDIFRFGGSYGSIQTLTIDTIRHVAAGFNHFSVDNFESSADLMELGGLDVYFKNAALNSTATVFYESWKFDNLRINAGKTVNLASGKTYTILANFEAPGLPDKPIYIIATDLGVQSTISQSSGTICTDYLYLSDIKASGGASYYAGIHSSNVGNNTGWSFTACDLLYAYYNHPVCRNENIQLGASFIPGATYSWTGPDNFTSGLQNPVIANPTIKNYGVYEVTAAGKTSVVYVRPENYPSGIIESNNYALYYNDSKPQYSFQWFKNNSIMTGEIYSAITPRESGEYFVVISFSEGCKDTSKVCSYVYNPMSYQPTNLKAEAVSKSEIQLTWESVSGSFDTFFQIERSSQGPYEGYELIETVSGTVRSFIDNRVNKGVTYYYRIRETKDSYYSDYSDVASAIILVNSTITGMEFSEPLILPNPSQGLFYLKMPDNTAQYVIVYNGHGEVVLQEVLADVVTGKLESMDMTGFAKGVYLIQVITGKGSYSSKLFLK